MDWRHDDYTLTDDRDRADVAAIHALLATTYWASDRSREASLQGSSRPVT